jgi:subtilisin family serine protease
LLLCLLGALCAAPTVAAATRTDPLQDQEWFLHAVGADAAAPPGPGVPITIVDSGVDTTQPDFAGRPSTTYLNDQTVNGPAEFHGTEVASVAAAPANGIGIVGVYPQAALDSYDVTPTPGAPGGFDLAAGIDAAPCPGVINLSFGGSNPDQQLEDAILLAEHRGCLVVAAAGNEGDKGNPTIYPAAYPHVLAVGAIDEHDQLAPFSSFGGWVDLVAPGVDIPVDTTLSHDPSGTTTEDGTSFAAPIVSAAAAWIWTARPTLTAMQVAALLRTTARDVGSPGRDIQTGFGALDIAAALAAPTPALDPDEPNDDVRQVKPGALFQDGEPALTSPLHPSNRIAATLDDAKDPRDVYRIWVPAHRYVRVAVSADGDAAARIWGPQTVSIDEGILARRRDLKGPRIHAARKGFYAYVEVLLTGRNDTAGYVLQVTASKR